MTTASFYILTDIKAINKIAYIDTTNLNKNDTIIIQVKATINLKNNICEVDNKNTNSNTNNSYLSYSLNKIASIFEDNKDSIIKENLSKPNETIEHLYKMKLNREKIFVEEQLKNVIFEKQITNLDFKISNENISSIIKSNQIFFLKSYIDSIDSYGSINNKFERFKNILSPTSFMKTLNSAISISNEIVLSISSNYDKYIQTDKQNLNNKNKLLQSKQVLKFSEIFHFIKNREKILYNILDIDVEATNTLVELNYLKYSLIQDFNVNIIDIINNLKEKYETVLRIKKLNKDFLETL